MIKNSFWESIIWVIIWVFILAFIILWITNLIISNGNVLDTYENKRVLSTLRDNSKNIIKRIDTSAVKETEVFYLYKNQTTKNYEIFTWTVNYSYKYIDRYWNKVNDLDAYLWDIYSRIFWVERSDNSISGKTHQIIKASIKQLIKK